jgi:endonuclease/exonuclease/phosphatase family metal-dependent hydrolase
LDWNDRRVTLVNFHMTPTTGISSLSRVERSARLREAEARLLADLARDSGPAIVGGDANCTSLSMPYRILTGDLVDAWREAGFGLGHTFPGSDIPESDRPRLGSWYVPQWLARIDYILHSEEWETLSARLARFDGISDHRGVVAVLRLAVGE